MGMSGRLLRPRQNLHPDAASWASRVVANGGSVGSSLPAVNAFCKAIAAAGIRDRFYRLNLFCGASDASLNAVRTPLYLGPSLTGTQYGNTTDTNNNFVGGDYAETGATGGLKGNGSTKYLNPGITFGTVPVENCVLAAYASDMETSGSSVAFSLLGHLRSNAGFVGASLQSFWEFGVAQRRMDMNATGSATLSQTGTLPAAAFVSAGHVSGTSYAMFSNGVSVATTTATVTAQTTNTVSPLHVFARNNATNNSSVQNSPTTFTSARMRAYSIGISMTAAQQLAYYNAMQAFQTAMGRNV